MLKHVVNNRSIYAQKKLFAHFYVRRIPICYWEVFCGPASLALRLNNIFEYVNEKTPHITFYLQ